MQLACSFIPLPHLFARVHIVPFISLVCLQALSSSMLQLLFGDTFLLAPGAHPVAFWDSGEWRIQAQQMPATVTEITQ
jgi:hypothetical protein